MQTPSIVDNSALIGGVIGGLVGLLLLLAVGFFLWRRRRSRSDASSSDDISMSYAGASMPRSTTMVSSIGTAAVSSQATEFVDVDAVRKPKLDTNYEVISVVNQYDTITSPLE
jgi:hypothetical protein